MPTQAHSPEAKRLFMQGNQHLKARNWLEAIASYRRALLESPSLGEALGNVGYCFEQLRQPEEAIAAYQGALTASPQSAQIAFNLGNVLRSEGRFAEAIGAYERALALEPDHARCLNNLGTVLQASGLTERALACYQKALDARADYAEALNNRGTALLATNDVAGALDAYRRALALDPTLERARVNEALALLVSGNLAEGWALYEHRSAHPEHTLRPHRRWRGDFSLEGKSILLTWEQGLGDTLQFARFASRLADTGALVHLEVQPSLRSLLTSLRGIARVHAAGEPLPPVDATCPLLSVPHALGLGIDALPGEMPYLHATPQSADRWGRALGSAGNRVGVVWSGSSAHRNDRWRSIPARLMATIVEGLPVHAVCLHRGLSQADRDCVAGTSIDLSLVDALDDFETTAAVVSHLDLVVTVDTAVAHLAGALGKPVWILLPFSPDWRWLLDRTNSPWYPSAHLFRQSRPGDWDDPLARVRGALCERFAPA